MKSLLQISAAVIFAAGMMLGTGCTVVEHDHDTVKSEPATPSRVEHSEKSAHVETRDNGLNSQHTEVETEHREVRETVK